MQNVTTSYMGDAHVMLTKVVEATAQLVLNYTLQYFSLNQ
jgi:hypothetical protein